MSDESRVADEERVLEEEEPMGSNGKGTLNEGGSNGGVSEGESPRERDEPAPESAPEPEPTPTQKRSPREKGRMGRRVKQATKAAHFIADRQDHVARALALLHDLGVLDTATRDRLASRYQEGDAATRRLLREQVQRILAGAQRDSMTEGSGHAAQDPLTTEHEVDPQRIEPGEVEVLQALASEHVDVQEVADYVQHLDPMRWLGDPKHPGALMRFFSEVPLVVHRFQRRVFWAGVFMIVFAAVLVATAFTVPAIVPYVGVAGVVLLALLFGYWLLRGSIWVDRAVKKQGIDLDVYARLPDDERRLLLIRRIGMRMIDPQKLAAALERSMHGHGHKSAAKKRSPMADRKALPAVPEHAPSIEDSGAQPAGQPEQPENAADKSASTSNEKPLHDRPDPTRTPTQAGPSDDGRLKRVLEFTRDMIDRTVGPRETAKQTAKEVGHELADRAKQAGHQLDEARQRGQKRWEEHRAQKTHAEAAPKKTVRKATKKRSPRKTAAKKRTAKKSPGKKTAAKKRGKKQPNRKSTKKATRKTSKKATKKQGHTSTKKRTAKKAAGAKKRARKGKKRSGQSTR